ncbi:MAG: HAMP domain-containing histidine kinase [Spirochaetales bacterium]|nr:HAMP domain-containing histidine kinase [Spirochaetales bacterium]
MILLYFIIFILLALVFILSVRMMALSRSVNLLTEELDMILSEESNVLLTTSSGERSVKKLVERINVELKKLLKIKSQYSKGILDLKCSAENVAHDIRTPLTAIKGYVDLLEKEEISSDGRKYLEIIKDRVEYMKALTDELFLSLSMKNRGIKTLEEIDAKSILEEALVSYYSEFQKKNIEPEIVLPENRVRIKGDEKALYRVYLNIITNALKYGEDFKVEMNEKGDTVFSNYSPSLDSVDVNRLLDRYYTISDAKASSGIGLSISKEIIEEMGGELRVKLEENRLYISLSFQR